MNSVFDNVTVLITGGAGSIASEVVSELLLKQVRAVRVFDNNEDALFKLKRRFQGDLRLRLLLGDIRDRERVKMAMKDVDIVIHTAAIKNIEVSEYNAAETCRINIDGTINLIENAMQLGVKRFLFISTDKAAEYSTLYGATKYVGERLTIWASRISTNTVFSAVRFGNVMETRGNVFTVWKKEDAEGKPLSITHPEMKRFFMHIDEAAKFIVSTVENMESGYTYIPKMRFYRLKDLAEAFNKGKTGVNLIGLRSGEKMEEVLFTSHEQTKLEDCGSHWKIKE